ncbi:MAG: ferredoxin family protein [Candidatus Bathyarchaeia archaeon]
MRKLHSIRIDPAKCTSCQMCVKVCWEDVIRWDEGAGKPIAMYPEDCVVCGLCEVLCPAGAIEVIPDWQSKRWPRELSRAPNAATIIPS